MLSATALLLLLYMKHGRYYSVARLPFWDRFGVYAPSLNMNGGTVTAIAKDTVICYGTTRECSE